MQDQTTNWQITFHILPSQQKLWSIFCENFEEKQACYKEVHSTVIQFSHCIFYWHQRDTVKCRYTAVQYKMILHISLYRLRQSINQSLSPNGRAMRCILWEFGRKITAVMHRTVTHYGLDNVATILEKPILNALSTVKITVFSLEFVFEGPIDHQSVLVLVIAWCHQETRHCLN